MGSTLGHHGGRPRDTARASRRARARRGVYAIVTFAILGVTPPASGDGVPPSDSTAAEADRPEPITEPVPDAAGLRVRGRASRVGEPAARGGRWTMTGAAASAEPVDDPRPWHGFALVTEGSPEGADCLCGGAIFTDGFETGDTTAWSQVLP